MKINTELELLTESGISLNQYLFLLFIHNKDKIGLSKYISRFNCFTKREIDELLELEYLITQSTGEDKYFIINLETTEKFNIFVPPKVESWIDEWYNLWPSGIKSGGYYVRCDKNNCKTKLDKFLKSNPEYNKEIIIEATRNYIIDSEKAGYKYMKMAPYFIEKNGSSALAGYCEAIMNNYSQSSESTFIEEI